MIDPEVTARCSRGDALARQRAATGRDLSQRTPLPQGHDDRDDPKQKKRAFDSKLQSPTLFNPRPCLPCYVRQLRLAEATTLIFSRRRSVTSCRNRAFSSWSSAIRSSSARVRSGSLASGVTTNARCGPGGALCHRRKVMTLTPSVRAISLCSFPCVANSSACANFVAISTLECLFLLGIAACPIRPPPYVVPQNSFCALGATQCVPSPINGNQLSRCRFNTRDCGRCVVRTYGM